MPIRRAPVVSEDPAIQAYVDRGVRERRNLTAIADERAYALADVVVVDVQLDVTERHFESASSVAVDVEPFRAAGATWWIDGNWSDVTASLAASID